ncbi:hypothetical protein HMPREF0322_03872 [Desulfitobacterium hafniense DP7]|uniref:Uncharacterized protein n=3 Tax=Desulfitobacterium hafniense TaxID=49338 RepID=Q24ZQ7_DESHY|nr:hypothetical protein HMPREF0322_03872 [Desulfitobacterium hafniense DP7]KTE89087.1 hypothetical protein AT727_13760 [Desulfitobacterium hafniense]BAE82485.1 hypothetical protein DSY0696 [Desulfitobacterium hafniense Y51]
MEYSDFYDTVCDATKIAIVYNSHRLQKDLQQVMVSKIYLAAKGTLEGAASLLSPQGRREKPNSWMESRFRRAKPWSFKMKAVIMTKKVLDLIRKTRKYGFVPKRDNVVVFGDMSCLNCLLHRNTYTALIERSSA